MTTSGEVAAAARRMRRRRTVMLGSRVSIARWAASTASRGRRVHQNVDVLPDEPPAAPRTSTATKSAAIASPSG